MGHSLLRRWHFWLIIAAGGLVLGGSALVLALRMQADKRVGQPLREFQSSLSFPLYYPSSLPTYFFIDAGSVSTASDTLIFPVTRNDGQKIIITEQPLPQGYRLSDVNGLQHELPGVGTAVIGSGFLNQRAVLKTPKTLILLSATPQISVDDLQKVTYGLRPI